MRVFAFWHIFGFVLFVRQHWVTASEVCQTCCKGRWENLLLSTHTHTLLGIEISSVQPAVICKNMGALAQQLFISFKSRGAVGRKNVCAHENLLYPAIKLILKPDVRDQPQVHGPREGGSKGEVEGLG